MAVKIKNTETGAIEELSCVIDGIDILADVMGGSGVERDYTEDGMVYLLDEYGIEWWRTWAENEQAIHAAREDACKEAVEADDALISDFGYDMELLQEKEMALFGISDASYEVVYHDDQTDNEWRDGATFPSLEDAIAHARENMKAGEHAVIYEASDEEHAVMVWADDDARTVFELSIEHDNRHWFESDGEAYVTEEEAIEAAEKYIADWSGEHSSTVVEVRRNVYEGDDLMDSEAVWSKEA